MSARKNVPATEVRAWGRANIDLVPESDRGALGETARGRLGAGLVKAFEKDNKTKTYTPKEAEGARITVPVTGLDKAGRKTTRKVTVSAREAREALGHEAGRKGRVSHSDLSDVLSQREAAKVAGQFS